MIEIQCPEKCTSLNEATLFVAGGISNCPLWQKELLALLQDVNIVILNPRRDNYNMDNLGLEEEQIKWEHDHLKRATAFVFWFPCETLCPITLFELGKVSAGSKKKIFIGTHSDYPRQRDIRWQMLLLRPEIDIVHSLESLAGQIKEWVATNPSPVLPSP